MLPCQGYCQIPLCQRRRVAGPRVRDLTVETAYLAQKGDYHLALLRKRYNQNALPSVTLADMRQEQSRETARPSASPLYQEIQKNLELGQQTILFLNRRGNSRQMICPGCGYVPQCPRCSVYLTYHSANRRMMCHYCGYSEPFAEDCPECGEPFKPIGSGTQKVEQELRELFPRDTYPADGYRLGRRRQHEKMLQKFEKERIPILLGTQMVAKGLDFDKLRWWAFWRRTNHFMWTTIGRRSTLCAADAGGGTGRTGHQSWDGLLSRPIHRKIEVLLDAAAQDYDSFFQREIDLRRIRREPPFADEVVLTVTGTEEEAVRRACVQVRDGLRRAVSEGAICRDGP